MPPSEKQTREGSHRSKEIAHTTPSRQNEVRSQVPENLGFLWSIDAVELIHDGKPRYKPVCDTKDNGACSYWFPPNKKRYFKKTKGCLYQWKMGRSTRIQKDVSFSKLKRYSVASVFFQERQDNFLVAAMDCTAEDVKKAELGWCQIRFYHRPGDLSEVGIAAMYDGLQAPATGSSWMPQVLPEVYNCHMRDPKLPKKPVGTGGLCGNLSILFGMAAFSAPVGKAEEAITNSFSLGRWIRHSFAEDGDCRYQNRGVVATIYLDPKAEGITEQTLTAFEDGQYGAIFASALSEQTPELPASERSIPSHTLSYQPRVQTASTYDPVVPRVVVAPEIYPPSNLGGGSSSPRGNYTYSYSSGSRPADNYSQRTAGPSAHPSTVYTPTQAGIRTLNEDEEDEPGYGDP